MSIAADNAPLPHRCDSKKTYQRCCGAAAPHRFSGESVPHRCHIARVSQDMLPLRCHAASVSQDTLPFRCHSATTKSFPAPLPCRNIFENTCRCRATAAVVTQISHKEAYFYKSEEYVIFSVNNQYLFDY